MDLRVYHPQLISTDIGVNCNRVVFDEHGISETLCQADFDTFCSIPGYTSLGSYRESLAEDELDTFLSDPEDALPPGGEMPEEVTDDEGQEIAEHEEDETLAQAVFGAPDPAGAFHALSLEKRLDLASDSRLTEAQTVQIEAWESHQRKSKRVLNAVDRRLTALRSSKSAMSVTNGMLKANFPAHVES